MAGAGDERPVDLRIGGWLPPTGRRSAPGPEAAVTQPLPVVPEPALPGYDIATPSAPAGADSRISRRTHGGPPVPAGAHGPGNPCSPGNPRSHADPSNHGKPPSPGNPRSHADPSNHGKPPSPGNPLGPGKPLSLGNLFSLGNALGRGAGDDRGDGLGPADRRPGADRRWRTAALVAIATVVAAIGLPLLLLDRHADEPGPDRQVQPPPAVLPPTGSAPTVPTVPASAPGPSPVQTSAPAATRRPDPTRRPSRAAPARPKPGAPAPDRVRPSGAPPAAPAYAVSIEAEGRSAERHGRARPAWLPGASGGMVVDRIGDGSRNLVRFPGVVAPASGDYTVTLHYVSGTFRWAALVVNGRSTLVRFRPTGLGRDDVGSVSLRLPLRAGANSIEYRNRRDPAPDLDRITITG